LVIEFDKNILLVKGINFVREKRESTSWWEDKVSSKSKTEKLDESDRRLYINKLTYISNFSIRNMNFLKTYHAQGTRKSINAILSENKVLEKVGHLPSSPSIIRLEICSHAMTNTKIPCWIVPCAFQVFGSSLNLITTI
jgi:hypothetical protein